MFNLQENLLITHSCDRPSLNQEAMASMFQMYFLFRMIESDIDFPKYLNLQRVKFVCS